MKAINNNFNLQFFGDGGILPATDTIDYTDPLTGALVKIPEEMKSLMGHVITKTRKDVTKTFEERNKPILEKMESMAAENEEMAASIIELRESSMSGDEKKKAEKEKIRAEAEKALKVATEQAAHWQGQFYKMKQEVDIYRSFEDSKLCNPEQAAVLFMTEGGAKVEEIKDAAGNPTGKYTTMMTLSLPKGEDGEFEEVTGTPADLFKRWVSQNKNLHHLENGLKPGGGSKPGEGKQQPTGLKGQLQAAQEQYNKTRSKDDMARVISLKGQIAKSKET